ncbi:MAG: hypothetical protein PHD15_06815 [Clostridia bacterium]|nr:hypothetical protein [Clostridia bacterium]MDD4387440.1 hypothetical protein [Clostridia bacterium]
MVNFFERKNGISLIALIITIVVVIILAGAILLSLANNNPITSAKEATILTSVGAVQNALDLYKLKIMSETFQNPTVSELIDNNIVAQLPLEDANEEDGLYNVIIIERIRPKT